MAHKKAAGSAKNLRDSKPKYRGVKVFGGQIVKKGGIIIRQKGDKYKMGKNTHKGRDFSIHASINGIVVFRKKRMSRYDGRVYLRTIVDVVTDNEMTEIEQTKKAQKEQDISEKKSSKTSKNKKKDVSKKKTVSKKASTTKKAVAKKTTTTTKKKTTKSKK